MGVPLWRKQCYHRVANETARALNSNDRVCTCHKIVSKRIICERAIDMSRFVFELQLMRVESSNIDPGVFVLPSTIEVVMENGPYRSQSLTSRQLRKVEETSRITRVSFGSAREFGINGRGLPSVIFELQKQTPESYINNDVFVVCRAARGICIRNGHMLRSLLPNERARLENNIVYVMSGSVPVVALKVFIRDAEEPAVRQAFASMPILPGA